MTGANIDCNPLVTVIICVYNAGEYFRPSLESILKQTYSNLEIIVIDDGSTDGCIETATALFADPRVRLVRQANATKPVALNRALEMTHGEFYAQHDADDISKPTRIEKQLAALLNKPDVAAAFCGHELILRGRAVAPQFAARSEADCREVIEGFSLPALDPTGMFRMSLVRDMRYDPSVPGLEGVDYTLRVGEKHPIIVVGECLYQYRILESSLTRGDPLKRQKRLEKTIEMAYKRRGLTHTEMPRGSHLVKWRSKNAIRDNYLAIQFSISVVDQKNANMMLGALKTGIQCAMLHPFDIDYYRPLGRAVIPLGVFRSVKALALKNQEISAQDT